MDENKITGEVHVTYEDGTITVKKCAGFGWIIGRCLAAACKQISIMAGVEDDAVLHMVKEAMAGLIFEEDGKTGDE